MVITRISEYGFKISQGSYSIAINPPVDKKSAINGTFTADLILLSAENTGFDGVENFTKDSKATFIINSPGEYEKDGLFIYGLPSTTLYTDKKSAGKSSDVQARNNVIYFFNLDGLDVCVLGAHEPTSLSQQAAELIDNIDILFVPIMSDMVMDSIAASKLVTKLDPKIIIPTGFTDESDQNLKNFIADSGHDFQAADKLTIKEKDVSAKPTIYFLK
jgi:L-ascorbate metabolism protein UlaG (beta-lactamase superfamily)